MVDAFRAWLVELSELDVILFFGLSALAGMSLIGLVVWMGWRAEDPPYRGKRRATRDRPPTFQARRPRRVGELDPFTGEPAWVMIHPGPAEVLVYPARP